MLSLPNFSFKLPRFSFRFFIFFLFALVVLVLVVEGGYYFFSQRKKEARSTNTVWGELIEGQIKEIKGRTLLITVKDNSLIPRKVEIEVLSDVQVIIPPSRGLVNKILSAGEENEGEFAAQLEAATKFILFTDLKVGDIIQASILTKLTGTKFKAESIAVIKE